MIVCPPSPPSPWCTFLWFLRIFSDFRICYKSPFASEFSWRKRRSHKGKKEVACICVQTSSFLFVGMWRNRKSSKMKHPGGSGALCSRPKGDPGPQPIFQNLFVCQITPCKTRTLTLWISSQALENILRLNGSTITRKELQVLHDACLDPALSVSKQAVASLTTLLVEKNTCAPLQK